MASFAPASLLKRARVVCRLLVAVVATGACAVTHAQPVPARSSDKVAPEIAAVAAAVRARLGTTPPTDLRTLSTDVVRVNDAGEIQVYVVLSEFRPEYVTRLEAAGLRVEITLSEFRLIQGWIPASVVETLARFDFVVEVKPPGYQVRPRG